MKTELQYKTFDELLDSVKIDLRTYDLEGMIDNQSLIKVAQRVNYELGLRINPNRTKMLEVTNFRAKLPSDFYVLNHALLCLGSIEMQNPPLWSYKTYNQGVADGIYKAQFEIYRDMVEQFDITMSLSSGLNTIQHNLGTNHVIVQALDMNNDMILLGVVVVDKDTIQLDTNNNSYSNVRITIMGSKSSCDSECPQTGVIIPPNPCVVETSCNSTTLTSENGSPVAINNCNGRVRKFKQLYRLNVKRSKSVSADCVELNSKDYYTVHLKNGFLETNFQEGEVLIQYESLMEDDEGNLLVLSHPYADEFYEYALKERIYENLAQAGENTTQLAQYMAAKLREARNRALGFINTPDFAELKQLWETNRKAQYSKYYDMFKSRMPYHPYYS